MYIYIKIVQYCNLYENNRRDFFFYFIKKSINGAIPNL